MLENIESGLTGTHKVLQIHPTRQCNLRCLHCYSSSGPERRDELDVSILRGVLTDGASEGYTVAGFSGGEPILYRHLRELLEHARHCDMVTTVTSNGMLLDARRLELLRGVVDLLAISLDGIPESHNRLRGSELAFPKMAERLQGVRQSGIKFGFIFTLTQHNLHELDWVLKFALEQGASLLQIHPLEGVGRAKQMLSGATPDGIEMSFAYLEALRIQGVAGGRLRVHLDLADREFLCSYPARVFADDSEVEATHRRLADLVSPLIVEADGTIVPIQYGFARKFALGNLQDATLNTLADLWRKECYPYFRELCRRVFEHLMASAEPPFVNWYEVISREAERATVVSS